MTETNDIVPWLTGVHTEVETVALQALAGYDFGEPDDIHPCDRTARWWSNYQRVYVKRTEEPPVEWLDRRKPGTTLADLMVEPLATFHSAAYPAAYHTTLHDPYAALARIAAERKILELHHEVHGGVCEECDQGRRSCGCVPEGDYPCETVKLIASGWSPMPGYRAEWAP